MNFSILKNDINLFKDETLKTLRKIETQLLEKIKLKDIETESKIAKFDLKISKFQEINKRMYESVVEQNVYLEKIKHLNDVQSKTETRLISFDVKLSNYLSDLVNIKTRYDKLFLENLTVPGIIGNSCKFHTISDYINDSINTADEIKREKELIKKQVEELKTKNESFEKKLGVSIDNSISTCKLYTDKKIEEIKNFISQKLDDFEEFISNTKIKIEENVLKNEQISSTIKEEIKNTKEEITILIEENNKENEKIKNEIKKNQTIEFKKEINEMKKNFTDLKSNMEKQIVNAYKLGKNKLKMNELNTNSSLSNNNIFLKTNNIIDETKTNNDINKKDHVKFATDEKTNILNKKREIFSSLNKKESKKNLNLIVNLLKDKNENKNKIEPLIKDKNNNINHNINNKNKNNIDEQEKYRIKIGGKNIQLRNTISSNNIKRKKENKKDDDLLIKQFNTINSNKEHKILMPENLTKIKNDLNSITNKEILTNNDAISRNKSFSKISNNKLILEGQILSERSNKINLDTKHINKNKELCDEKNNDNKIVYENKKKPKTTTKYIIHSIDGENTMSNLQRKNSDKENNNPKKNIAIKLIKNKMKNIKDSNVAYLQQQTPTLILYKEYYDRKMKNFQKEKLSEVELTEQIPKKISSAFGRTAYIKFEKENEEKNMKNYNGNMNIVFNEHINDYMNKNKYFYTMNNEANQINSLISKNNKVKKIKSKEETFNLSV